MKEKKLKEEYEKAGSPLTLGNILSIAASSLEHINLKFINSIKENI